MLHDAAPTKYRRSEVHDGSALRIRVGHDHGNLHPNKSNSDGDLKHNGHNIDQPHNHI